jgi:hypothetical protein
MDRLNALADEFAAALEAAREDAERYRWLRTMAKEQLLDPRAAGSEWLDMRTHWRLPTLICSGPVGGFMSFDAAVDQARGKGSGNGCHCATCMCNPGMTPAVRFDTTPAEKEGAIRDHLIALGWTPPGAQKPVTHPAITHCDNCGCDWLDNGLNPIGCPYCKQPAARRAAAMSDDINLPPLPAQQCAQEQDGEYSREDDPNFNEAMTGNLLAQAEYWDAVARQGGRNDE